MVPSENIVHVIDDDEAVRESLAFLLGTMDLTVRTYESGRRFLDELGDEPHGCVVTDIRMPEMSGLDLVRRLKARNYALPVIVITGHADVPLAVESMRAGVADFIEKPFSDDAILAAVRAALDLRRSRVGVAADRRAIQQRLDSLSVRERQVLDGLVAGHANKVVAQNLGISPRTVEVYRANLMGKMQAASLSDLVRMTLESERPD